jgi:hypothetical protein
MTAKHKKNCHIPKDSVLNKGHDKTKTEINFKIQVSTACLGDEKEPVGCDPGSK